MGEKTEQPTPKRLRDARQKGQVCKSQDVASSAIIVVMIIFMMAYFPTCRLRLEMLMRAGFSSVSNPDFDSAVIVMREMGVGVFIAIGMVPPLIAAVTGLVANMSQVGLLTAFESVMPKLDKLNPTNWFKNVFSKKNLLEFLKGVVKMTVIVLVFWKSVEKNLPQILAMPIAGYEAILSVVGHVLWDISKVLMGMFAAVAAVDYLLQRKLYNEQMMMSMEDIKNEYKEMEGDAQVKGQRKSFHQDLIFGEDDARVDNSNVVVTNPSHYAVALRYVKGQTPLPIIMMKGMDGAAVRIMRMAERRGIPIYRNVPLARALFSLGGELEYVPSELIEEVAEVIRWLQEEYPVEHDEMAQA